VVNTFLEGLSHHATFPSPLRASLAGQSISTTPESQTGAMPVPPTTQAARTLNQFKHTSTITRIAPSNTTCLIAHLPCFAPCLRGQPPCCLLWPRPQQAQCRSHGKPGKCKAPNHLQRKTALRLSTPVSLPWKRISRSHGHSFPLPACFRLNQGRPSCAVPPSQSAVPQCLALLLSLSTSN